MRGLGDVGMAEVYGVAIVSPYTVPPLLWNIVVDIVAVDRFQLSIVAGRAVYSGCYRAVSPPICRASS